LEPLILSNFTLTSSIGCGRSELEQSFADQRSGLSPCDSKFADLDTYIGCVDKVEKLAVIDRLKNFACRNNQLAQLALEQDGFAQSVEDAIARYGPGKIGLFLGTSTSGILETENAYLHRDPATGDLPETFHYLETHNNFSVAAFVQKYFKLEGPALVISTACSSSAKVFAEASRFIQAGFCDAAIVGGVDSLCKTTLYGFSSLELISSKPCRPADPERNGLSIGEAGGFALLEKPENCASQNQIAFLGHGESSDAYHMTTPPPDGAGMAQSMQSALVCSGLNASQISYINLHGTATTTNDSAEDQAVSKVFGSSTPCSSTKGWTGHTLGAAGIAEAIISAICLKNNFIPGSLNTRNVDPDFCSNIILQSRPENLQYVLSNSFGFGGNNCSLIFGIHS
jgi:3-oxoacyl-[acyl-carrier-protein] synthase-1